MEIEEIQQLIKRNGGYISLTALKKYFKEDNLEILEMKLNYLVDKRKVKAVNFQATGTGHDILYLLPWE